MAVYTGERAGRGRPFTMARYGLLSAEAPGSTLTCAIRDMRPGIQHILCTGSFY